MLNITEHDRDKVGLKYVYPVLSRRSGGLSIGINLNTNNACNWRCIYCQVPNLKRGSPPLVDFDLLSKELRNFLGDVIHGDFYEKEAVPDEQRVIRDVAISGNGEPTTSSEFHQAVNLINRILEEYDLVGNIKCVLITNGSQVHKQHVQKGIKKLSTMNGEVWFKIDSATKAGIERINHAVGNMTETLAKLQQAATLCPTWIQTCFFEYNGSAPSEVETEAYLDLLKTVKEQGIPIRGLMIYGVARQSHQPEAKYITSLPQTWFDALSEKLKPFQFDVKITP